MRRWEPATASRILMQRLTDSGLPAYTYTGPDGSPRVHAGLLAIPGAGLDITVLPAPGACHFVSEWGNAIGDTRHLADVVEYVLWLFGMTARARH